MAKKLSAKQIDKMVEQAYYKRCSGIQIMVSDMGKVLAVGRQAFAEGQDLEEAVAAFVEKIRQN